jgi:hypothetical protein
MPAEQRAALIGSFGHMRPDDIFELHRDTSRDGTHATSPISTQAPAHHMSSSGHESSRRSSSPASGLSGPPHSIPVQMAQAAGLHPGPTPPLQLHMSAGYSPAPGFLGPQQSQLLAPRPAAFAGSRQHAAPRGCGPDAIKLFVGNIPKHYTENQLRPFFETVGPVAELVILRDRMTHESKGGAFLWYTCLAHADLAMSRFNLSHVLPDPTGHMTRPLVVRPANLRPGAGMPLTRSPMQQAMAYPDPAGPGQQALMYTTGRQVPALGRSRSWQSDQSSPWQADLPGQQQVLLSQGPGQMAGLLSPPAMSAQPPLLPSTPLVAAGQQQQQLLPAGGPGPGPAVTLSLQLSNQQVATISEHLYSVQAISGAGVSTTPMAAGLTSLLVSGSEAQVEHAKQMVLELLSHGYIIA